MSKGIYAAASAMVVETRALEATAQNMANVQSAGFRKLSALRGSFSEHLASQGRGTALARDGGAGVRPTGTWHSFAQGNLEATKSPLDMAISGDGFYRVRDDQGQLLLTRAGNFAIDGDGRLVNDHGWMVEGQGGPVTVPPEAESIVADLEGRLYAESYDENGAKIHTFIDQLRVVQVPDPAAMAAHNGQYFHPGDQPQEDVATDAFQIRQGFVEKSNVDPIQELVSMISIQRRYDAAQRAMKQQAETGQGFSDILRGA